MPEIPPRPKSDALIQAQVAAFAAERLPLAEDADYVLGNINTIARDSPDTVSRVVTAVEYVRDASGGFVRNEAGRMMKRLPGDERSIASRADYANHLREVGGANHEPIARRAELLTAFSNFEPLVDDLRASISSADARENHPGYLGSGSNADAFLISLDDHKYVVRVPRGDTADSAAVDHHLQGAMGANGLPRLEQVVAASYEKGVTISELMVGQEMRGMTPDDLRAITAEQLDELVTTLETAHDGGVVIDPKPSNFFYDRQEGFGIIDVGTAKNSTVDAQTPAKNAAEVPRVLRNAGTYGALPETTEDYRSSYEMASACLPVLEQYKQVVRGRFEGEELESIIHETDEVIANVQKNY